MLLSGYGLIAQTASITLNVKGLTEAKGAMSVALFDSEEDYDSKDKYTVAGDYPVDSIVFVYTFTDLPSGTYAVKVYHDIDGNGEMKKNWIGIPKEPFGFSNDAKGKMGPPSFENASFKVNSDTEIEINLMEL